MSDTPKTQTQGRIVVVISGSGSNLQAIIDGCSNGKIPGTVVGVISNNPDAFGLERATRAGIATAVLDHRQYESREAYDRSLADLIESFSPDLILLAGFMRVLTVEFVSQFRGKLLNIHPSLLPKYKGLHTHKRVLENGDSEHGATVHYVTEELDGGPLIIQGAIPVESQDDENSLAQKVQSRIEHQIYSLATIWCLNGRAALTENGVELDGEPLGSSGYQYQPGA